MYGVVVDGAIDGGWVQVVPPLQGPAKGDAGEEGAGVDGDGDEDDGDDGEPGEAAFHHFHGVASFRWF